MAESCQSNETGPNPGKTRVSGPTQTTLSEPIGVVDRGWCVRTGSFQAIVWVVTVGCASASGPAHAPPVEPRDVQIVRGNGYTKSAYEDGGRTIVTFQLDVSNTGTDAGRSENPRCHVVVDGELHYLDVYENPELAPGEKGIFRTGGPLPPQSPREMDNLEVSCGL